MRIRSLCFCLAFAYALCAWASPPPRHVGGSPFYEFELVARAGDFVFGAENDYELVWNWREVTINDHGRVAFIGEMVDEADAVANVLIADRPDGGLRWLNTAHWVSQDLTFNLTFPQINNHGHVVVNYGTTQICEQNCSWDPNCEFQYPGGPVRVYDVTAGGGEFRMVEGEGIIITPGADPVDVYIPIEDNASWPFKFGQTGLANDGHVVYLAHESEMCAMTYTNSLNLGAPGVEHDRIRLNDIVRWNPPAIADDRAVVMRKGTHDSSSIVLYRDGEPPLTLASTHLGDFEALHYAPAISSDGQVIAFIGRDDDGIEGIYLSAFDSTGSLLFDAVRVLASTSTIAFTTTGTAITLGDFGSELENTHMEPAGTPARRLAIIRHNMGDPDKIIGDHFILAFMATPSAAQGDNPTTGGPLLFTDQPGIWTLRVDAQMTLGHPHTQVLNPWGPLPVIQVGDLIDGQPITDLHFWHGLGRGISYPDGSPRQTLSGAPTPAEHVLAFAADTSADRMIVRAIHFDSDQDGLPDHWERPNGGIDMNRDGVPDLVLADWGADPMRFDLFVEADFSAPKLFGAPVRWQNRPPAEAFHFAADVFADAPIINPDGSFGITLHVDAGPGVDSVSRLPYSVNTGSGSLQGGDLFSVFGDRADRVYFGLPDDQFFPGFVERSFHAIKDQYFGTTDRRARELAFRYGLFADFHKIKLSGAVAAANRFSFEPVTPIPPGNLDSTVIIVSGTGAGQFRYVNIASSQWDRVVITTPWLEVPDSSSEFVIMSSSAGKAEVFFRNNPNYHSLPGNDFLVTLGGWRRDRNGRLANQRVIEDTIVHELGHTLGLRHGGTDHCAHKGIHYQSLMNYSFSNRQSTNAPIRNKCIAPTNTVPSGPLIDSYAGAADETFDDWSYIMPHPYGHMGMVGNAFGSLADAPYEEWTFPEFLEERDGAYDILNPVVEFIDPSERIAVDFGGTLNLILRVTDDQGVESVQVSFDVNGDGETTGPGESIEATPIGNNLYSATFTNIHGAATTRTLSVVATDVSGNKTYHHPSVRVGSEGFPTTFGPWINFQSPAQTQRHVIGGGVAVRVSLSASVGIDHVLIGVDLNGDGVITGSVEFARAAEVSPNQFDAYFEEFTGPPGTRQIVIYAYDEWLNRSTLHRSIPVVEFTTNTPNLFNLEPVPGTEVGLQSSFDVALHLDPVSDGLTVTAQFDIQGNGWLWSRTMTHVGGGRYETTFPAQFNPPITGPEGPRDVLFTVTDVLDNTTTTSTWVQVTDMASPQIGFTAPTSRALINLGSTLTNLLTVTDDQSVAGVRVRFDIDGDGATDGAGEDINATFIGGNQYRALFPSVSGPPGQRWIAVEAWDPSGKTSVATRAVQVVDGGLIRYPVSGDTIEPGSTFDLWFEFASGVNPHEVRMMFDRHGTGDFDQPGDWLPAQTNLAANTYLASFADIQGSGTRTARVEWVDAELNVFTSEVVVVVGPAPAFAGEVSERLGSVPLLPERLDSGGIGSSGPAQLTCVDGLLFFTASDGESGTELWRSDGTRAGTFLLRDINLDWDLDSPFGPDPVPLSAAITNLVAFNGRLYFSAQDNQGSAFIDPLPGDTGAELWTSDGTIEGTHIVKDIRPGPDSSTPRHTVVFNDRLFFSATDGSSAGQHGVELWWSDGTEAGTELFMDLNPGTAGSNPSELTVAGTQLFFRAFNNTQLWVSDGTVPGTRSITNLTFIWPGITAVGDRVFFEATSPGVGRELWVSDGTTAGTYLVKDIRPGTAHSSPAQLTALGELLIFTADDGVHGREVWVSDGTEAGTMLLRDIQPGGASSTPEWLTLFGEHVYFAATAPTLGRELWRTDGTVEGTGPAVIVAPFIGTPSTFQPYPSPNANPNHLGVFSNRLFFAADDGGGDTGSELWVSDGSDDGTYLVRDIAPGKYVGQFSVRFPNGSFPMYCTPCGDLLYFTAMDGYQRELWAADGTATGTRRVANIRAASAPSITVVGSNLYFAGSTLTHGREPWLWDGAHVRLLADLYPGPLESRPRAFTDFDGDALFVADNRPKPATTNHMAAIYRSDGTETGTEEIQALDTFGAPSFPTFYPLGTSAYFAASLSNGVELWITDGTAPGTREVRDIWPGTGSALPAHPFALDGILYFTALDGVTGRELWRSDGTTEGTWQVADINTGSAGANPGRFTALDGSLYFIALTPTAGYELWRYDPASNEVGMVRQIGPGATSGLSPSDEPLTTWSNHLYFGASDGIYGKEPWISDGTLAGTELLRDIMPGSSTASSEPHSFVPAGRHLFFSAVGPDSRELWRTDGTTDGTIQLKNIRRPHPVLLNPRASDPRDFVEVNGLLFFTAYNDAVGRELWRSDGTSFGTVLVKDIHPGPRDAMIRDLTPLGNRLFFTANDGVHGRELWVTDGTLEGTYMVEDLMSGPMSSSPSSLTVHDGALYYLAADGSADLTLRRYVPEGPTAFEEWLDSVANFAGADRLASADPDGDGLSNIMEYDLSTDPDNPYSGPAFEYGLERVGVAGHNDLFQFQYRRRVNAYDRGLRYAIQYSDDLKTWLTKSFTETVQDDGDGWETVTVDFTVGMIHQTYFIRLIVMTGVP